MKLVKRQASDTVGNYLRIKDGESKIGVFRGDLHSFKIRWENGKSIEVPEPDAAKHNRYKVNFVTVDDQKKVVALVWEFGITIYDQLYDFSLEIDLSRTKIKITRRGTGTDTAYTLVPLGPADIRAIEGIALNPLNKEESELNFGPPPSDPFFDNNSEIPF